jgi:hypothetical protein
MQYFLSSKPSTAVHLWNEAAADTYCRMYSTGGIGKGGNYKVTGNKNGRRVCKNCRQVYSKKYGRRRAVRRPAEDICDLDREYLAITADSEPVVTLFSQ